MALRLRGKREKMVGERKPKAVIVGGSIAGVSAAHALSLAGWDVVVLEKTTAPPTGTPTGAGLGLDSLSQSIIRSWLSQPHLLHNATLPLTIDQVPCAFQISIPFSIFMPSSEIINYNNVSQFLPFF